ncbi:tetratricopeptide repeat protein [Leifsonia sp. YIM 134122]|uniref:Tetratricopeptide repeat protein n=1 Tax=Leifsonia stereocauli TaxID=3134136 RepID=A0ABU9W2A4_9MICO
MQHPTPSDDWNARVEAVWAAADELGDDAVIERIDALAAERGADDARALFERAGARDSAGLESEAAPLYREALAGGGLDEVHRPQAVIQLASTLRNLGEVEESIRMLEAERVQHPESPLDDAAAAFLALALVTRGDAERAASVALSALAPHLQLYTRSVHAYAAELAL